MLKGVKTILFTSDLTPEARHAFNHAALLATEFKAKIILLHVIEDLSETVDVKLRGIFGSKKWKEVLDRQSQDVHRILMGKVTDREMVKAALNDFCHQAGVADQECGLVEREIVVKNGKVVENVLEQIKIHDCDMVVMGACRGLISGTSIGHTIKTVMKKSQIPVLIVPPAKEA